MLYKRKYLIGIYYDYEDNDSLIALLESSKEFAEFLGVRDGDAQYLLNAAFHHKTSYVKYNGKRAKIYFIEDDLSLN